MDNKLRQLENQSLPDLSKQDKHWLEMKQMLAPAATPVKPAAKTGSWKWFVAAGIAGGIIWLAGELFTADNKDRKPVTNTTKTETVPAKESTTATDTGRIIPKHDTAARPAEASAAALTIGIKPQLPPKDHKVASIVTPPCPKCNTDWLNEPLPDTTVAKHVPPQTEDAKATLAAFFAQLEKPSQEFVVDGKKDTVIYGKDGTALLVPANTFNANGKITLVLREYYSYEDIITNKLSTSSDGKQLVSGGMIHLTALSNGKEVDLQPNKSITWFIPDTTAEMNEMEIFRGESQPNSNDQTQSNAGILAQATGTINWKQENRSFEKTYVYVKVLDLRNEPYITWYSNKGGIGKFIISPDSKITKEEIEKALIKKHPYYHKVKVKTQKDKISFFGRVFPFLSAEKNVRYKENWESLGDSTWITPELAKRYRLPATDTMISKYSTTISSSNTVTTGFRQIIFNGRGDTAVSESSYTYSAQPTNTSLLSLGKKFNVDIKKLGWVNCDRFYKYDREKIDFFVNINDTAQNYYTILVFDKIKSVMAGQGSGDRVLFPGIPKGMNVKVVSIGVKNGKTIATITPAKVSKDELIKLKFEETTPSDFRKQVASLDK